MKRSLLIILMATLSFLGNSQVKKAPQGVKSHKTIVKKANAENTRKYSVRVESAKVKEGGVSLVFQCVARTEVSPGMFLDPGTMGELTVTGAKYNLKELKKGTIVQIIEEWRDEQWMVISIKKAVKDK